MARRNTREGLWAYIDTHDNDPKPCWEWLGKCSGRDDRPYYNFEGKRRIVARQIYEDVFGPFDPALIVRHTCDFQRCCNPNHFVLGTRGDNEDDKYMRDRAGYTHDMLKDIRRFRKLGMSYKKIQNAVNERHGTAISRSGVQGVCTNKRRKKQNDEATNATAGGDNGVGEEAASD